MTKIFAVFYGCRSIKYADLCNVKQLDFRVLFQFHFEACWTGSTPQTHAHTLHLGCYLLSQEYKEDCTVFRKQEALM